SALRIKPRFDRLHVEADGGTIGSIQLFQEIRRGCAVVHRRATNKAEAGQRNDLAHAGRTMMVSGQLSVVSCLAFALSALRFAPIVHGPSSIVDKIFFGRLAIIHWR